MTNEVKNVPELRFPNFEGKWEEKKLGDLVSIISGYSPSYYSIGGEYPLYKVNDLNNNNKYQIYSELYVSKKGEPTSNKTIIFPKRGAAILLNKIRIMITPGYIDTNLMGLQFEDINNTEFYYYTILKEGLFKIADTSTIPQINNKHILNYKINLPDNSERNKLGDFFNKLDRQIELEEQKLEKLEEQKKGYMQKIFSKELRFKDENGNNYPEWEEKNLKELIDVRDGTHESPKPSKDGYLLVTSKNLKNSKLDLSESYFISKEDYESINQRSKVEIGDILFGMIGTIGNPILLEECDFAIKNVALLKTNDLLEKYYILNFLKSSNISKQFYRMNAGGTQKFIALSTIRDLNIDMPSSEEAIKIGNFFNKVDNLIENQSNKLELLKKRKQGFLQKMFI